MEQIYGLDQLEGSIRAEVYSEFCKVYGKVVTVRDFHRFIGEKYGLVGKNSRVKVSSVTEKIGKPASCYQYVGGDLTMLVNYFLDNHCSDVEGYYCFDLFNWFRDKNKGYVQCSGCGVEVFTDCVLEHFGGELTVVKGYGKKFYNSRERGKFMDMFVK